MEMPLALKLLSFVTKFLPPFISPLIKKIIIPTFFSLPHGEKIKAIKYINAVIASPVCSPSEALLRRYRLHSFGIWIAPDLMKLVLDYLGMAQGTAFFKEEKRAAYFLRHTGFIEVKDGKINVKYSHITGLLAIFLAVLTVALWGLYEIALNINPSILFYSICTLAAMLSIVYLYFIYDIIACYFKLSAFARRFNALSQ